MKHVPIPRARGIKSVRGQDDLSALIAQVNRSVADLRTEQEEAIAALRKGQEDVVRTEKIERIDNSISALTATIEETRAAVDAARIGAGDGNALTSDQRAHASAFDAWARRGVEPANGMRSLEVSAALTTESDPDGGYLVPEAMEAALERVLGEESAMRRLAKVVSVGGGGYTVPFNMGGAGSGWVGEHDARPETATPKLSELSLSWGELYANPAATQRMLDDARFDIEAWLSDEIAIEFGEKEGGAFIGGNGVNKPRGLLAYEAVANADYVWGKLGYVPSGAAADFKAASATGSPADALVDLYHSLKSGYRNNAAWLMNDLTVAKIRKFKTADGAWLWQPPTSEAPPTILGKPLYTDDNMPTVEADALAIAFADFRRAYTIGDRFGTRVLRDPYTNKPFVHFYATKRVGGAVTNFEAVKLLKIATN